MVRNKFYEAFLKFRRRLFLFIFKQHKQLNSGWANSKRVCTAQSVGDRSIFSSIKPKLDIGLFVDLASLNSPVFA